LAQDGQAAVFPAKSALGPEHKSIEWERYICQQEACCKSLHNTSVLACASQSYDTLGGLCNDHDIAPLLHIVYVSTTHRLNSQPRIMHNNNSVVQAPSE
jgi:hypothetical protein